jgi:predicted Zn-dependent protease
VRGRRWTRRQWFLGTLGAALAAILILIGYRLLPQIAAEVVPEAWFEPIGTAALTELAEGHAFCPAGEGSEVLTRLARRLAATEGYDGPLAVAVLDAPSVNAFALPGGHIVLMRGLMDQSDPDEVAGVLAHEVGHVVKRHVQIAVVRNLLATLLRPLATGGGTAGELSGAGSLLLGLSYGRADERAADAAGVAMLQGLGLEVGGLRHFLERLQSAEGGSERFPWLSTHPATADRVAAAPRSSGGASAFTQSDWVAFRHLCP